MSFFRQLFDKEGRSEDAVAGVVLGVESVPDGLAAGLLAGVNPIFGLHAYLFGTMAGALSTSSAYMAVQATGAMAIIVADVDLGAGGEDPERVLFTLAMMTGLIMLVAGLLRLGSILRFVSNAVMTGFISAVGVNIVLGQFGDFTGYEAEGSGRVARAIDTLIHPGRIDGSTIAIGIMTIALIVLFERTRLGPLGLVVAVAITSGVVIALDWDVAQLRDLADIPSALPRPEVPLIGAVPSLMVPAFALAFVGLVQGAAISTNVANPDGKYPDASRDFVGQGVANLVAGTFRGMPVGGSMSATSLVRTAGARTRRANLIAAGIMALVILLLADVVEVIAMPALAGLLMVVGIRTVKPAEIIAIARTGPSQATVMAVTFVLAMLVPLQDAVLVGVGISMILFVITRSNRVDVKQWEPDEEGRFREREPVGVVPDGEVVVLQPYGSLFFASAPVFEAAIPEVGAATRNSVVIIRLRGFEDLGSTFMEVISRYATQLQDRTSKLILVSASRRVQDQLEATGVVEVLGAENVYDTDEWLGATLKRAHADALVWIEERTSPPTD